MISCDFCGYEPRGNTDRAKRRDLEQHEIKEHYEKDASETKSEPPKPMDGNGVKRICPILSIGQPEFEPCKGTSCMWFYSLCNKGVKR